MTTDSPNSAADPADAADGATGATGATDAPAGTPETSASRVDGGASWRARYVEFVLWVVVVGGLISAVCVAVGLAVGGSLVTAKYVLFVVGFLLFGAGSFAIQPTSPRRDEPRVSIEGTHQSRLEARIQEIPPIRGERLPFDRRIDRGPKLFVASLVVLGVSMLLEFGLGVRV